MKIPNKDFNKLMEYCRSLVEKLGEEPDSKKEKYSWFNEQINCEIDMLNEYIKILEEFPMDENDKKDSISNRNFININIKAGIFRTLDYLTELEELISKAKNHSKLLSDVIKLRNRFIEDIIKIKNIDNDLYNNIILNDGKGKLIEHIISVYYKNQRRKNLGLDEINLTMEETASGGIYSYYIDEKNKQMKEKIINPDGIMDDPEEEREG